jgi:uncharacterized membrane protein YeaQ/YmgE (transglycosylase-associated protein family)
MSVESPRVRSLLRQAENVASVGKRAAAEQLYRQIIDEAPETAEAWYGLAQVVRDGEERDAAMARAQELNPDFESAGEEQNDSDENSADTVGRLSEAKGEVTFSRDGPARAEESEGATVSKRTAVPQGEEATHVHEATSASSVDRATSTEVLYCTNHPGRQTHLRCNRCGKPICSSCANPTPVGYRCPECIREQEDVYFTATPLDYLVSTLAAFLLSLAIGWLATLILSSPFGFFLIFLGAFSGSLVGRIAFRAARRRRGRWMPQLVVACVIIGGVLPALGFLISALLGQFSLRLLFLGIYLMAAAGAAYYQMR